MTLQAGTDPVCLVHGSSGLAQRQTPPRRAEAPVPRACRIRGRPLSRMLTAGVAVCVRSVSAGRALEGCLGFAILLADMSTLSAGLRRVGRVHLHHQTGLVLQVAFQPAPAGGQDLPVESGLGLDVRAGLLRPVPFALRVMAWVSRSSSTTASARVRQLAAVLVGGRSPRRRRCLRCSLRNCPFTRRARLDQRLPGTAGSVPGPWPPGAACA